MELQQQLGQQMQLALAQHEQRKRQEQEQERMQRMLDSHSTLL